MDYAQAAAAAAEQRNQAAKATAVNSTSDEQDATQLTCDVLCSLGAVASPSAPASASAASNHTNNHNNNYCHGNLAGIPHEAMALDPNPCTKGGKSPSLSACPKQHQLPMFLSSK